MRRAQLCGDVIDACAAPGNKTMHLASLLSRTLATVGSGSGSGHTGCVVLGVERKCGDAVYFFALSFLARVVMRMFVSKCHVQSDGNQ